MYLFPPHCFRAQKQASQRKGYQYEIVIDIKMVLNMCSVVWFVTRRRLLPCARLIIERVSYDCGGVLLRYACLAIVVDDVLAHTIRYSCLLHSCSMPIYMCLTFQI